MWHYVETNMANLTLAVEEQLLGKMRDYAAKHGTTVNALIREHFETLTRNEYRLAQAKRELRELSEKTEASLGPNYTFDREEVYGEREFPRYQHSDLRRSGKKQ
jgi:hypothetical protein